MGILTSTFENNDGDGNTNTNYISITLNCYKRSLRKENEQVWRKHLREEKLASEIRQE